VAQATKLVASDPSPLGFAASGVVSAVSGNRSAPLRWTEPPAELDFGPEQGLSSVELGVVVDAASARFVHWVPGEPGPDLVGCAPDEVQLDALVSFATEGGAFAESFPAVLHATTFDAARLSLSLPLATLKGAFSVNPVAGGRTNAVVLDAELSAQATNGTLRGQLERTAGNTASVLFFSIACWPADGPACASP
jgi:hypothetical protein